MKLSSSKQKPKINKKIYVIRGFLLIKFVNFELSVTK